MQYTLATDEGYEWDEDYDEDEDWDLEAYMEKEESIKLKDQPSVSFQIDTSDLDAFKDKWMDN
jgi:hypothetical protein